MKALLAEFLGTFFLMVIILVSVILELPYPPLIIGIGLTAIVYATGPASGAHLNPAITIGFLLRKKFPTKSVLPYIVVQLLGAALGSLLVTELLGIQYAGNAALWNGSQSFWGEVIGTFLLAVVIYCVATLERTKGNNYYGVAIGGIVMIGAFLFGSWSGAYFNPATVVACMMAGLSSVTQLLPLMLTLFGTVIITVVLFNRAEKFLER